MFKIIEGVLSPMLEIDLVKLESEAEHLARVQQRFEQARASMGTKYLCDQANRVQRKDGKSYAPAPQAANVRPMRKRKAA